MQVFLTNVAHVPYLHYHLFSLPTLFKNGRTFEGRPTGVVAKLWSERTIVLPLSRTLYSHYGYRVNCSSREDVCDVLAPGQLPKNPAIDINNYQCATGHSHEVLLCKTADQQEIVLEGKLLERRGAPWGRVSAKVSSSPRTHEQIRSSGEFLLIQVDLRW